MTFFMFPPSVPQIASPAAATKVMTRAYSAMVCPDCGRLYRIQTRYTRSMLIPPIQGVKPRLDQPESQLTCRGASSQNALVSSRSLGKKRWISVEDLAFQNHDRG